MGFQLKNLTITVIYNYVRLTSKYRNKFKDKKRITYYFRQKKSFLRPLCEIRQT